MKIIKRDDRDQHQQAAQGRVNKKLDRRIDAIFAAPDADKEKHRNQRRFKEKIKNEQIERDENADHRAFQQQQKNVKSRVAFFDRVPGRDHRDRHYERRQNHQPQAQPVNADVIIRVYRLYPRHVLLEEKSARAKPRLCRQQKEATAEN